MPTYSLTVPNKNGAYDGDMVVANYTSLTISAGNILTVDQPCRGLLIYVQGDCNINGTLSMTARGANADPTATGASDVNAVDSLGLRLPFKTASGSSSLAAVNSLLNGCGIAARNSIANHRSISSNGTVITVQRIGAAAASGTGCASGYAVTDGNNGTTGQSGSGGSGGRATGGMYSGSGGGGAGSCFAGGAGGGGSLKIAFQINGSSISLYKTGTAIISISQPPLNQWTHLSVVRSSSTGLAYIFVNGVLGTSGSFGSEAVTSNFQLFTNGEGATSGMYGYLSSFRVSNIARQITAFTVPTQPYQADTNTILLTNFTDAAILDSTGRQVLETLADAKSSSVITKFTGGSMSFDGTGDYNQIADNPLLELGTGDFTIESWIYPTLIVGSNRAILGHGTDGNNWWGFFLQPTGELEFGAASGGSVFLDRISSNTISLNTWTHVAVTRSGSTFKLWINGSEPPSYTGSPATTSSAITDWSTPFWIGGPRWTGNTTSNFVGYIDDLRITKFARYTANFTPPTAPHRLK